MLTRLKVNGFKNLVNVDVYFGPFTCVAGANGVGKSNLFDAIRFLSALADKPFMEAVSVIRDEEGRTVDVRDLFHRVGDTPDPRMSFEVEMIVPSEGYDDLGQQAEASITFLVYKVELAHRSDSKSRSSGSLELTFEELNYVKLGEAIHHLRFPHKPAWRNSTVQGRRTGPFISTDGDKIQLHQDGTGGRPRSLLASSLPRTVLSASNAAESPTALIARREMQSWKLLQLEPSVLRLPDDTTAPTSIGHDGAHLPATLYHLANLENDVEGVYSKVANRLSELIDDIHYVSILYDEQRELLTLHATDRSGTSYPAKSLSDGTLRFLALAVMEVDPTTSGLLCMEEPENGIHPGRIPAMIQLLKDIAVDTSWPVGPDNPLRQVIINTHSPAVVQQVPQDTLLVAEPEELLDSARRFNHVSFKCLPSTWRADLTDNVSMGALLSYLNPAPFVDAEQHPSDIRVIDRLDVYQLMFPEFVEQNESN